MPTIKLEIKISAGEWKILRKHYTEKEIKLGIHEAGLAEMLSLAYQKAGVELYEEKEWSDDDE